MQSLSARVSLESLLNILSNSAGESTVYSYCFRDVAARRWIGIVTGCDKGIKVSIKNPKKVKFLLKLLEK